MLGVGDSIGRAVLVGGGVCVGAFVGGSCVADGTGDAVGVSVMGMFEGRLQASIAKTSKRAGNKVRVFIISPLISSYMGIEPLTIDHLDSFLK
jgi:hypothetical protein